MVHFNFLGFSKKVNQVLYLGPEVLLYSNKRNSEEKIRSGWESEETPRGRCVFDSDKGIELVVIRLGKTAKEQVGQMFSCDMFCLVYDINKTYNN